MIQKTLCAKCKFAKIQIANLYQGYLYATDLFHAGYFIFVFWFDLCIVMEIMNTLE
jgi:hypothetical protein